jgi:hypothetical protein
VRNQPEAAIEACERALRLSPFDPFNWTSAYGIAIAFYPPEVAELLVTGLRLAGLPEA